MGQKSNGMKSSQMGHPDSYSKLKAVYNYINNDSRTRVSEADLKNEFQVLIELFKLHNVGTNYVAMYQNRNWEFNQSNSDLIENILLQGVKHIIDKAYLGVQTEGKLKQKYENTITTLRQALDSEQHLSERLSNEKEKYKKERDGYKKRLDLLLMESKEVENKNEDVEYVSKPTYDAVVGERDALAEKLKKVQDNLTQYKESFDDFVSQTEKETNKALRMKDDEIRKLQEKLDSLNAPAVSSVPVSKPIIEVNGATEGMNDGIDYKKEYEKLQQENVKLLSENKRLNRNMENLSNRNGYLRNTLDNTTERKDELEQELNLYKENEKKLLPEYQKTVYCRRRQGKGISLSKKQIKEVVGDYLKGESCNSIHIDRNVPYKSVSDIVHCNYKGISALRSVLLCLKEMNGNWGSERKEMLESLISTYENAISMWEVQDKKIKKEIKEQVNSTGAYIEALNNSYMSYEYEGSANKKRVVDASFHMGVKPPEQDVNSLDRVSDDGSGEEIVDETLYEEIIDAL